MDGRLARIAGGGLLFVAFPSRRTPQRRDHRYRPATLLQWFWERRRLGGRPGAATADANLSLPPADAQRRRDWSGTVGRGLADAIVAALFDSGDSLAERCR